MQEVTLPTEQVDQINLYVLECMQVYTVQWSCYEYCTVHNMYIGSEVMVRVNTIFYSTVYVYRLFHLCSSLSYHLLFSMLGVSAG